MSLKERLFTHMKGAMKDKEAGKQKLNVIRMVRAAIKNEEIRAKKDLTDEEIIEVIAREVKQRRDAIPEYEKGNRLDVVESLYAEIDILMEYLPEQLSEADLRKMILEAIHAVKANSPKDMGKVMGKLMPQIKGKADGKLVSKIVTELLS